MKTSLYLKIGAAVVVLAIVAYFLFFRSPSPQELYAEYYQPLPNYVAPIETSIENEFVGPLHKGLEHYVNNNLDLAIAVFENSLQQNPDQADMIMYLGLTYQISGNHTKAIELLEQAVEKETQFLVAAKWHLGLSYLFCEKEGYLHLFRDVQSDTSTLATKAQSLLVHIES